LHDWTFDDTVADSGTICASDSQGFALRAKRFTVHANRGLNRDRLWGVSRAASCASSRASRSVALLRQQ